MLEDYINCIRMANSVCLEKNMEVLWLTFYQDGFGYKLQKFGFKVVHKILPYIISLETLALGTIAQY